jgi:hypothetical protein
MSVSKQTLYVIAAICLGTAASREGKTQPADALQQSLESITNAAIKVCDVVKTEGSSRSGKVASEIKVQLSGLAKLWATLGFGGESDYEVAHWVGPIQADLPAVVKIISDCRIRMVVQFSAFKEASNPAAAPQKITRLI